MSHGASAPRSSPPGLVALVPLLTLACRSTEAPVRAPAVQIVEDADRRARGEPLPASSTIFDGQVVHLRAARGETVGFTVWQRTPGAVVLRFIEPQIGVAGFEVQQAQVARPSTAMYGGSRGAASYADGLIPRSAPTSQPSYFDVTVPSALGPGRYLGALAAGDRQLAVELQVEPVVLPELGARPRVWAYYDPRELSWQHAAAVGTPELLGLEARCAAMFRAHGVLATPELTPEDWPARRALVSGARYLPVKLPDDPAELPAAARFWSEALAATDQLAFAIPIDEPRTEARRAEVRALADAVVAARRSTGTTRLLLAVTDAPAPRYGDAIDIYISPLAVSRQPPAGAAAAAARWTYNGRPPAAGSMVVDAGNADLRSWGWIAWRWQVPLWYVWDALYWHDRHNARRAGLPRPGRAMTAADAVTFDDGDDHGNLDGVLALPGDAELPCRPTLRLKGLRRGLFDRLLLEAASCTAASRVEAEAVAASLFPVALADAPAERGGDAGAGAPVSPTRWAAARARLLDLAAQCGR